MTFIFKVIALKVLRVGLPQATDDRSADESVVGACSPLFYTLEGMPGNAAAAQMLVSPFAAQPFTTSPFKF